MEEESDFTILDKKEKKKKKKKDKKRKGRKKKKKKKKKKGESEAETATETEAETETETEMTQEVIPTRKSSHKTQEGSKVRVGSRVSINERRLSDARALEEENLMLRRSLNEVNRLLEPETNEEIFMRPRRSSQFKIYETVECPPIEPTFQPSGYMPNPHEGMRYNDEDMVSSKKNTFDSYPSQKNADNYLSQIKLYRIIITVMIGVLGLGIVVFISAGRISPGCQVGGLNPTAAGVASKKADGNLPCVHSNGQSQEQSQNGGVNYRGRGPRDQAHVRREQGGRGGIKRKHNGRC